MYATPREALLLNAKFVAAQLSGLDGTAAAGSTKFGELPFMASLIEEVSQQECATCCLDCKAIVSMAVPLVRNSVVLPCNSSACILSSSGGMSSAGPCTGAAASRRPRGRRHDHP